jgi:hypothetical protein
MKPRRFWGAKAGSVALVLAGIGVVLAVASVTLAQRGSFDTSWRAPLAVPENAAYDGRFKFTRLKFTTGPGGYY